MKKIIEDYLDELSTLDQFPQIEFMTRVSDHDGETEWGGLEATGLLNRQDLVYFSKVENGKVVLPKYVLDNTPIYE